MSKSLSKGEVQKKLNEYGIVRLRKDSKVTEGFLPEGTEVIGFKVVSCEEDKATVTLLCEDGTEVQLAQQVTLENFAEIFDTDEYKDEEKKEERLFLVYTFFRLFTFAYGLVLTWCIPYAFSTDDYFVQSNLQGLALELLVYGGILFLVSWIVYLTLYTVYLRHKLRH